MNLDEAIADAHDIVDEALAVHLDGHELVGIVVLFSGGNDSTVLAHLMRERATHYAHANTGIGVEATRQFVRDTVAGWGKPLLERSGESYRDLVLGYGFPGPAHHWKMYVRLKERALDQVRRELVLNGCRQRVLYLAGMRRSESRRRSANVQRHHRNRSIMWASPIVEWTAELLGEYRERFEVPHNEVTDHLHMSGECLCGAYAKPGELDMIGLFYPEVREQIEALEAEVAAAGQTRCRWGDGNDREAYRSRSGPLCSSCDARFDEVVVEVTS